MGTLYKNEVIERNLLSGKCLRKMEEEILAKIKKGTMCSEKIIKIIRSKVLTTKTKIRIYKNPR